MRLGLMVGPERNRYSTKVERMLNDAAWAESSGFSSVWIPQVPDEFDAMTAAALVGHTTSRIEIGTAVVVLQTRHPVALVQQAHSTSLVCGGRFTLGVGPSHHWVIEDMVGLSYTRPASVVSDYLDVLESASQGPGVVQVDNDSFHINNPMFVTDAPAVPVMVAALGPVMLRLAGERTDGTILWLADEKAIESHVVPKINAAAAAVGRAKPRVVAGVPVCLCRPDEVEAAKTRANRVLAEGTISPNYQRLLDQGNATNVGDILAAGDEQMVLDRLRAFESAGATDVSIRVLPIGADRDELIASSQRTREFLASIAPTFS